MLKKPITPESLISEEVFSKTVEGLLNLYDWRWQHQRPARRKEDGYGNEQWETAISGFKGFPDYVAAREWDKRVVWIELKSESGKVSAAQQAWIDLLRLCEREVYVIRPSQYEELKCILQ